MTTIIILAFFQGPSGEVKIAQKDTQEYRLLQAKKWALLGTKEEKLEYSGLVYFINGDTGSAGGQGRFGSGP